MSTEVASAFVTLIPSARGFARKLDSQISGDVDRTGKDAGKRFATGMTAGVGGMATKVFAPLAAAAGGIALGSFFKDAISGASDLNETTTKLDAIFGKASKSVQAFGKKGAKSLGQSRQSVLDAAATFGTFGKAAGLGGEKLADFSTGFAGLATDLASFNNTSPEEAVQAIGSALRGEAEPLRKYGVLLDDASMRQEAVRLGLIKTTKEALTPQNKVLAAQAIIYKQTKDAQGDFEKTSGGLANQQRILSAQFTDLKANLGKELLPVVVTVVKFFNNDVVPALAGVGDAIKGAFQSDFVQGFIGKVRGLVTKVGEIVGEIDLSGLGSSVTGSIGGALAGISGVVTDALGDVTVDFSGLAARVKDKAGTLLEALQTGIETGDYGPLGSALGDALAQAASGLVNGSAALVASIGKFFKDVAPQLAVEFGKQAPTILLGLATGLLNFDVGSLFRFFGDHLFEVLIGVITLALAPAKLVAVFARIPIVGPFVASILKAAVGASRSLLGVGQRLVTGILDGLERSAPALLSGAIGLLRSVGAILVTYGRLAVEGLVGLLKRAPGQAQGALASLPGLLGRVVGDAVGLFLKAALFLPRKFGEVLKSLGGVAIRAFMDVEKALFQAGLNVVQGLLNGIASKFQDVRRLLGRLTNLLPDWKGPAGVDAKLLYKSGQLVIGGFVAGLEDSYGDVRRSLGGLTDSLSASAQVKVAGASVGAATAPAAGNVYNIYPRSIGDEIQAATTVRALRNLQHVSA